MKTWITYLAAIFMGFATTLLFADSVALYSTMYTLMSISMNIGTLLFLPMVLISLSSGVASLRKDKLTKPAVSSSFFWAIITAFVLPLVASLLVSYKAVNFPVSSTAGADGSISGIIPASLSLAAEDLFCGNFFLMLTRSSSFILPIVIISWIIGYALTPSADVIKPAYTVMNSFSEVIFRVARTYTVFGYIFVYTSSSFFFTQLYQEKTIFVAPRFLITYLVICAIISLIILPLLFVIFTRGKRNPYLILFRSITPSIAALTSGNILFAGPMMEACSRHSLGEQKRIASTTVPLFSIIGKAGSATIAALSAITLVSAVTGSVPAIKELIIISLCCSLVSFASSLSLGLEIIFIVSGVFAILGINLYGAEMTMLGLLPLLSGLGCLLDVQLTMLGSAISGLTIETDIVPPYKDIL